jgi:hypothetical protein
VEQAELVCMELQAEAVAVAEQAVEDPVVEALEDHKQ